MAALEGRSLLWRVVISLTSLCALLGAVLLTAGLATPAFRDVGAAQAIKSGAQCEVGIPNPDANGVCESGLWHRSMNSLRTNKWRYVDAGLGLLASGLSFLIFGGLCRRAGCRSWPDLRTPKRSTTILALAALCWLAQIPAYWTYYFIEVAFRDCCPWWADSMGIPLVETPLIFGSLFLPYVAIWLIIWLVFFFRSRLPAPILAGASVPGVAAAIWTIVTMLLLAPVALYLGYAVLHGPTLLVPFLWLTIWLLICARAAALSRHSRVEA